MANEKENKKADARDALGVTDESGTRTIQAQFRRKAKELQSVPGQRSRKSFEELNEAYRLLIQNRKKDQSLPSKNVTILSSDVANWSGMLAAHEQDTLEFFDLCKDVFEECVEKYQGRIFNTAGDAILAEFDHVFNAVHCAVEIQRELRAINLGQPEGKKVLFRMGINQGEVFLQGEDLLGDAVNLAARIQTSAKPGGICLNGAIHDLIANKVQYAFTSLGKVSYKNIPTPVHTYALIENDGKAKVAADPGISALEAPVPRQPPPKKGAAVRSPSRGMAPILIALALAGGAFYVWNARHGESLAPRPVAAVSSEPGHVFVATTPPNAQISILADGQPVASGLSPFLEDVKPGRYRLRIENKALGIEDSVDLLVEAGKSLRVEKDYRDQQKPSALTPESAAATPAASSGGAVPLSPDEQSQKQQADTSKDAESAYRYGKSRLDKRELKDALTYLKLAAGFGHAKAQYELGKLYYAGQDVPMSIEGAVYWLLKSASQQNTEALDFLKMNKFPAEFMEPILTERKIAANDPKMQLLRKKQDLFLEILQEKVPN